MDWWVGVCFVKAVEVRNGAVGWGTKWCDKASLVMVRQIRNGTACNGEASYGEGR